MFLHGLKKSITLAITPVKRTMRDKLLVESLLTVEKSFPETSANVGYRGFTAIFCFYMFADLSIYWHILPLFIPDFPTGVGLYVHILPLSSISF